MRRLLGLALLLALGGTAVGETPKKAKPAKKAKRKHHPVDVSGFVTVLYKFRIDENDDGVVDPDAFRLGKAVVRVSGHATHRVGYVIEIDPRSPTIAGVARDAYVTVKVYPHQELRLGQQKTPFGYENWRSSIELYTIYRAELSEGLGRGVTHRDLGIGLVGNVPIDTCWRVEDAIAVVNGAGFGVQADDTQLKNVWGRIGVRYRHEGGVTVHAGVSGGVGDQMGEADPGPPAIPAERFGFRRAGADLELDQRWLFVGAEAAMGWDEIPAGSGETERSLAYFVTVAGKTPWHVGPVARFDAADAEGYQRVTIGAYYGEPEAPVRAIVHYERFEDDAGRHDGRVTAQISARF
jgi:hypothetical protein